MAGLLSRLASRGRGTDGKPFDYYTQCVADAQRVRQTLDELNKAIEARQEKQAAMQSDHDRKAQ